MLSLSACIIVREKAARSEHKYCFCASISDKGIRGGGAGSGSGRGGFRGGVFLTTAAASAAQSGPAMARGTEYILNPLTPAETCSISSLLTSEGTLKTQGLSAFSTFQVWDYLCNVI